MLNDKYELYLDYQLILQVTSAEMAISILLCLYNIFEIKFTRHSSSIHLLYGIMFQDQSELTKSMRKLLLSWDYVIEKKSVAYQHRTTADTITTTTVNNIILIQNTTSTETNDNNLNVLEQINSPKNHEMNEVDQEPAPMDSFDHTLQLGNL